LVFNFFIAEVSACIADLQISHLKNLAPFDILSPAGLLKTSTAVVKAHSIS
jgi:hypothetical protein